MVKRLAQLDQVAGDGVLNRYRGEADGRGLNHRKAGVANPTALIRAMAHDPIKLKMILSGN